MFQFLKRVFGSKTAAESPNPREMLKGKSLSEVLQYIDQLPERTSFAAMAAPTDRLFELAFFDRTVDDTVRLSALKCLGALRDSLRKLAEENPSLAEVHAAYQQAFEYSARGARQLGAGSLAWEIERRNLTGAAVIEFLALPENAAKLPALYETIDSDRLPEIRAAVERRRATQPGPN